MFGKLNENEIETVLKNQLIGRLGCHADNVTYVVPISYAYDGTYIYGRTFEGMKVNMLRKNPRVCFQADIMENMANWQSVIAWGDFEIVTETADRKKALEVLGNRVLPLVSSETTHLSPIWPFMPDDMENIKGLVFRIKLMEKTGRFEKNSFSY